MVIQSLSFQKQNEKQSKCNSQVSFIEEDSEGKLLCSLSVHSSWRTLHVAITHISFALFLGSVVSQETVARGSTRGSATWSTTEVAGWLRWSGRWESHAQIIQELSRHEKKKSRMRSQREIIQPKTIHCKVSLSSACSTLNSSFSTFSWLVYCETLFLSGSWATRCMHE